MGLIVCDRFGRDCAACVASWMPVPEPKIHDEFSYLLAGDTFALGRLCKSAASSVAFLRYFSRHSAPNLWSMYPPCAGGRARDGQLLGSSMDRRPVSAAAMCVAIDLDVAGWMRRMGAAGRGWVLVFLRFGLFSYWMNSYWARRAAIGGAASHGTFPRIYERRRPRDAVVFAWRGILATSRPFEGSFSAFR